MISIRKRIFFFYFPDSYEDTFSANFSATKYQFYLLYFASFTHYITHYIPFFSHTIKKKGINPVSLTYSGT